MTNIYEKVKAQLNIESTVLSLLGSGKRVGDNYYPLNPTRGDKTPGSFVIDLNKGKWKDFATGEGGGDVISLYAYVNRCSQYEAAQQLSDSRYSYSRATSPNTHTLSKAQYIQKIWGESQNVSNTVVEEYLRGRGYQGAIPDSIRYHSNLKHIETSTYGPAMIAAITTWPSNEVIALHRTWLKHAGSGKADIENNRKMIGSANGGAIRFAPIEKKLIIAEGIETALSVYTASKTPTWAVLSASFMRNVILPPPEELSEITIAADNDDAGLTAAVTLGDKLMKVGYIIKIATPQEKGADFNDLIKKHDR